ncbi:hypothetical protein PI125_g3280 [Phytophthora idaei]|nr:hypothetical protein PI125_g3280 [Phytophthora idaei]
MATLLGGSSINSTAVQSRTAIQRSGDDAYGPVDPSMI